MQFGALIIGDEILSGRRDDKHLAQLIKLLGARRLRLAWARYCGDERAALTAVLRQTIASGDVVFCFGGIGATPDDNTRQAAAAALELELALHPEAESLIRERFGSDITPHRLQMGVFPLGSEIIPNPYNQIPGFAIAKHFFVPGFPVMAWPMIEQVLDSRFGALAHQADYTEAAIVIQGSNEGAFIALMEDISARYSNASLFSLPIIGDSAATHAVEIGMKGAAAEVAAAMAEIRAEVKARGLESKEAAFQSGDGSRR